MPKVLPAIFSYEDMKRKFAQDNPDDPYTRRKDLETGLYALDNWLIRVDDDNKAISTVGFKEHPSHTVVGGMYASAKGREIGGNNRALQDAREPQLNQSKPLVAAFGHRDGDNARWISTAKQNGWIFPDSENWEQAKQMLPESVVNEWDSAYPNGNWAIRSIRGEGEFAKCVYLDDPTPSWFNLLKYLPDNTWDDFELGEPAPDLGTRDRFKDKNIKSKGKAEYKAFVSQQYLRQVSDRIPNAGTSLMKGWLEKLTEMNLKKGKYWFFGTNVKQDNTYVMIDVIEKGEPYTANADKKLNLEGFETAIIFTGVSKEMVGKVKRGQGIPEGRKFLDIHGKYGVRGLGRKERRFSKEPNNIFPTFEKSWEEILKLRLDNTFEDGEDDEGNELISPDRVDEDQPIYWSSNYNLLIRPHYEDMVEVRFSDHPDNNNEKLAEISAKLQENPAYRPGWFYVNDDLSDHSYITFRVYRPNEVYEGKTVDKKRSLFRNKKPNNVYFLDSIRSHGMGYPVRQQYKHFHDLWGTGVKEGHLEGDSEMDTYLRAEEKRKERQRKERSKISLEEDEKRREDRKREREYLESKPVKKLAKERKELINRMQSEHDQVEINIVNTSQGKKTREFNVNSAKKKLKELENIEPMVNQYADNYTGKEKNKEKEVNKYRTMLNEEKKYLEVFIEEKLKRLKNYKEKLDELNQRIKEEKQKLWKQFLKR